MAAADIKEVIVLGASGGFGTLFSQVRTPHDLIYIRRICSQGAYFRSVSILDLAFTARIRRT